MTDKEQEKSEFARLVGPVRPLKKVWNGLEQRPPKLKNWRKIEAQSYRADGTIFHALNLEQMSEGRFRRLVAGELESVREIDLHGFFVDEALRYLQDLIDERSNFRAEIWTIVHGKGKREIAPLKIAVWQLLQQHPAIVAIVPVLDYRGESGAVQIEIKGGRRRR